MRLLLELDPNIVKPGWTPLLITLGIALAMVLLFRSMRRQFRKVDENFPEPPQRTTGTPAPPVAPADAGTDATGSDAVSRSSTNGHQAERSPSG